MIAAAWICLFLPLLAAALITVRGNTITRRGAGFLATLACFGSFASAVVVCGNLLLLLAGWGLVGLSSYLLIGFHHERPSAIAAAKKAFVMNAIGDATMALSLFALIQHTGSLDFETTFAGAPSGGALPNLIAL